MRKWERFIMIGGIALATAAGLALLAIFVLVPAARYAKADALLDVDDIAGAYETLDRMEDYGDAQARKNQLQAGIIASRSAETMEFGGYEWLVMEERDGKALLLMKGILNETPFNETLVEVGWKKCTLRTWLNGAFYSSFGEAERARIAKTAVRNSGNPQYGAKAAGETTDYIFLLSAEEANLYFPGNAARIARGAKGANTWWWLRSPGLEPSLAMVVGSDGAIGYTGSGVNYANRAVRPALWVTPG